jgi:hypothetical protein
MKVVNVHERELRATAEQVGRLIDSLASSYDRLWPVQWPRMSFDRPLGVGAAGGHGPIRYDVEEYTPGRSVRFRFTGPRGFDGFHGYEVCAASAQSVVLRHTLRMRIRGPALLSWPLVFRPLHDAVIEDSLAAAEAALGQETRPRGWSAWVKLLRWLLSGGKAGPQVAPGRAV